VRRQRGRSRRTRSKRNGCGGSASAASRSLGVKHVRIPFAGVAEIERGLDQFAREPSGGLLVLPDSSTNLHGEQIIKLAAKHRTPAMYAFHHLIALGGLGYYGTDTINLYRRAVEYVDRILRGERPGDLPVQAPTKFELVIISGLQGLSASTCRRRCSPAPTR
jgi:ABC-type uncharacterized transport system substrate-binding protein